METFDSNTSMLFDVENTIPRNLNDAVAEELRALKAVETTMTLESLSAATKISRAQVVRLLQGQRDIDVADIAKFSIAFNVEPVELIRRAQERLANGPRPVGGTKS